MAAPALETPVANGTNHEEGAVNGATTEASPPLADTAQGSWETAAPPPAEATAAEEPQPTLDVQAPESVPATAETTEVQAASTEQPEMAKDKKEGPTPSPQERVARDELQPPY